MGSSTADNIIAGFGVDSARKRPDHRLGPSWRRRGVRSARPPGPSTIAQRSRVAPDPGASGTPSSTSFPIACAREFLLADRCALRRLGGDRRRVLKITLEGRGPSRALRTLRSLFPMSRPEVVRLETRVAEVTVGEHRRSRCAQPSGDQAKALRAVSGGKFYDVSAVR